MKCIICESEIKELDPKENDTSPVDCRMWNDSSVNVFHCGYGSSFDTDVIMIGLCDNCMAIKLESGIANKLSRDELFIRNEFYRLKRGR